jgi:hypothetical protein
MTKAITKTTSMPYLVGLDIGFGQLKWISNEYPQANVIPSGVHPGAKVPTSNHFDYESIDINHLVVSTEEGTFFVGKQALDIPGSGSKRTQVRDRANDLSSRVLFQTGLGLSVPHEDGQYDVHVVTGLPNDDYDLSIKDHLEAFIGRSFTISFHLSSTRSITKTINIVGSEIIRQPEGAVTYNQFVFDQENFLIGSKNARNIIGIIDAGHFTTDYALFQDGVIIEDTMLSGSTVAVTEVYKRLKKKLIVHFDQFGYMFEATDKDLDVIIRKGEFFYAGTTYDVSPQVEESAREVASSIAKDVLDSWGNETNRLESIILAGGGSYVFSEYLKEEFDARRKQGFNIIENPQYSNVIGFYMYGCITLVDKYEASDILKKYVNHVFEGVNQ